MDIYTYIETYINTGLGVINTRRAEAKKEGEENGIWYYGRYSL